MVLIPVTVFSAVETPPFSAALQMDSRKIRRVGAIVREPSLKRETYIVKSPRTSVHVLGDEGAIYIKCLSIPLVTAMKAWDRSGNEVFGRDIKGTLHAGLAKTVEDLLPQLRHEWSTILDRFGPLEGKEVIFTGYGSGASLSALLALDFKKNTGLYGSIILQQNQVKVVGFETQRMGDNLFADSLESVVAPHNILNFWYKEDMYRHNFFYYRQWKKGAYATTDVGRVLTSTGEDGFVLPTYPHSGVFHGFFKVCQFFSFSALFFDVYKKISTLSALLLNAYKRIGMLEDLIERKIPSPGILSRTTADVLESKSIFSCGSLYALIAIGGLSIFGSYCTKKATMFYMFTDNLLSSTINKYRESDGYFGGRGALSET